MSIEITYAKLEEQTRNKATTPFNSSAFTDSSGSGTFGATTVSIPAIQPYYIQINGFQPEDNTTSTNRSVDEVYSLLNIDKSKGSNAYKGRQIVINSGRIILNSYENYLMMFSKEGFVLSTKGTFNVDADEEVTLFGNEGIFLGVPNKGLPWEEIQKEKPIDTKKEELPDQTNITKPITEGQGDIINPVKVNNSDNIPVQDSVGYLEEVKAELSNKANERNVATPDRDYEPLPLANKLADWLSDLILVVQTLQISTPAGLGYVSAGDSQYNLKKLVSRIPEIVSTYAYIDGRSHLKVDDPGPPPPPPPAIIPTFTTGLGEGDSTLVSNSAGLGGPLGTIKQYTLAELQQRAKTLGLGPIDTVCSLVGIRSNQDNYDKFDDMFIFIVNTKLYYYACTTNPGAYYLQGGFKDFNPVGAAVLVPGQYTSHVQRLHGTANQYLAGGQNKNVKILRDGNLDQKAGNVPDTTMIEGGFGINIHRASATGTSSKVWNWSAGCQVFANGANFNYFMQTWKQSGKTLLQYTLFQQF